MAITVSGTAITFPDATSQTTAFSVTYAGAGGQVFTSSGTFTIPTGVSKVKVSVVGGGGGAANNPGCCPFTSGSAGNTSSVASGTQTISTVSATGGAGGVAGSTNAGGTGSGGDINIRGVSSLTNGPWGAITTLFGQLGTSALSPIYGGGGVNFNYGTTYGAGGSGGNAIKFLTGLTAGNTLTVTVGTGGAGGNGGQTGATGIVVIEW
jgi:hypothetical protein